MRTLRIPATRSPTAARMLRQTRSLGKSVRPLLIVISLPLDIFAMPSESKGDSRQERVDVVFSRLRRNKGRDVGQALAAVRPGVFIRQGEADEWHRPVRQPESDAVNEAILGIEISQHAVFPCGRLQQSGQPDLFPAQHGNKLRIAKL